MADMTQMAREMLANLDEMMAGLLPEHRNRLYAWRAELDHWCAQLRDGGWTQGQIGCMMLDSALTVGLERRIAVPFVMEMLK